MIRDFLSRSIYYPLVHNTVIDYGNVLYKEKSDIQFSLFNNVLDLQKKKLSSLVNYAYKKSIYYKKVMDSAGFDLDNFTFEQYQKIPILTKSIIREYSGELCTEPVDNLGRNTSGGSTGEPVIFYYDDKYGSHCSVNARVSDEIAGYFQGCKVAKIWGHPNDYSNYLKPWVRARFYFNNTNYYDAFNMSEKGMVKMHESLERFKPDLIIAYASSIYLYSKFLLKNDLKPIYPSISIITSAERLFPQMRELIEKVFDKKVFDRYGSREVGVVASQCEEGSYHLHSLDHYVEIIDGRLIITPLNNFGMPMLRYDVGDIAEFGNTECKCGRITHTIRNIVGRTSDIITLSNGKYVHGEYFTHAIYFLEGIENFQFVQEEIDKFTVRLVVSEGADKEKINNKILHTCYEMLDESKDKINIEYLDKIDTSGSGKYKFTISKVDTK